MVLEYRAEDGHDDRAAKLIDALHESPLLWGTKRAFKQALALGANLSDVSQQSGFATRLRALIYSLDRSARLTLQNRLVCDANNIESLDAVQSAKIQWDARRQHNFEVFAIKLNRPLMRKRELGVEISDKLPDNVMFEWPELLDALTAIVSSNASSTFKSFLSFGEMRIALKTPTLECLRSRFSQFRPQVRHMGVDDFISGLQWFHAQKLSSGELVLSKGTHKEMAKFAGTGIPTSMRPRMWRQLLGVWASEGDYTYYQRLVNHVREWDLITDELYRDEIRETSNDSAYFVFEEMLDEVMLAFSRDTWVPSNCSISINSAPLILAPAETSVSRDCRKPISVPMNGIIPFRRLVLLAAPLCYLFSRPEQCFFVFRQMYCRYFCRLHVISSQPDTIIFLCRTFEELVKERNPQTFFHSMELGISPIRIAFPWIFTAFAGFLPVQQVLILWDRILAYDSLALLPVLAAAVFLFRSELIDSAKTATEIREAFEDGSYFAVVPLLQNFLFSDLV